MWFSLSVSVVKLFLQSVGQKNKETCVNVEVFEIFSFYFQRGEYSRKKIFPEKEKTKTP